MENMAKMAKIHFFKRKKGKGSGNNKAFGQVAKIYADTYNKGDHDYW